LQLEGDPSIYTHTLTCDALRRLGAHPTVAAARRAVERAIRHRGGRAVAVRAGNQSSAFKVRIIWDARKGRIPWTESPRCNWVVSWNRSS